MHEQPRCGVLLDRQNSDGKVTRSLDNTEKRWKPCKTHCLQLLKWATASNKKHRPDSHDHRVKGTYKELPPALKVFSGG